jgi:predicted PurR-regulated permease PerM
MLKNFYILLFLFAGFFASAQEPQVEMADTFRQEGKIYVVIAVLAIVFVCIVGMLLLIERKLRRLEREIKETPPIGQVGKN